jgi:hypothetical protein
VAAVERRAEHETEAQGGECGATEEAYERDEEAGEEAETADDC